ncbi:MAG: glycosyltransferase [Patescibacteria group bacterium]
MIYFLIPSYNDSHNFPKLLSNINKSTRKAKKVIIVSDGSTDNTKEVLKGLSYKFLVKLLSYKPNRGPGFAFNHGFEYILNKANSNDVIITMEADNTSDHKLVEKLIKGLEKSEVVLASPYAKKGGGIVGISILRKLLSVVSNNLDKLLFRIPNVNTYTSFFRAYKVSALLKLKKGNRKNLIDENGFPSVVEILIRLHNSGANITEIPSTVDWTNKSGKSHMNVTRTITRHLVVYKNYLQGNYSK